MARRVVGLHGAWLEAGNDTSIDRDAYMELNWMVSQEHEQQRRIASRQDWLDRAALRGADSIFAQVINKEQELCNGADPTDEPTCIPCPLPPSMRFLG